MCTKDEFSFVRLGWIAALGFAFLLPAVGQDFPSKTKARLEFRWVESKKIDGITEDEGFRTSCDPDSIMYPHKKPALVLTSAEVTDATLKNHNFSNSGGAKSNYMVAFHLTQEAREKLAAQCDTMETKLLTITIDGRPWGLHRYEKDKDKPFVPEQCRAESFLPEVGFFSSHYQAQRLVDAVRKEQPAK